MHKVLVIAFGLAGISALADMERALASNPNVPKSCMADYRDCIRSNPDEPFCAQMEISCRKFNKDRGFKDPSDPTPGRNAGSLKAFTGLSPASPQGGHGGAAGIAVGSTLLKASPGSATATMPGARKPGSAVTNSGVISANGSAVTNSAVTVKRPAAVTGGAATLSAPGALKLKVQ